MRASPPHSEAELLARSVQIAGLSIGELARRHDLPIPTNSTRAKGFAGQLLELALGADAGSLPEPDFRLIGVELKTIPVTAQGKPLESTYVCTAELDNDRNPSWQHSVVQHKLSRVLWLPIVTSRGMVPAERRIGTAMLWSPSVVEQGQLRSDWEELMDLIVLGEVEQLSAHHGECLQIRPKAADSHARRWGVNEHGVRIKTLPRGFYLRPSFTAAILQRQYAGLSQ
ncbi:MAG: DNA mismatch repair protein MutH [Gammaproteobacteria bacterium]|jgi:DNA mismatch repair protein MutH